MLIPNSDTHREGKEQGVKKGGRGKKKKPDCPPGAAAEKSPGMGKYP